MNDELKPTYEGYWYHVQDAMLDLCGRRKDWFDMDNRLKKRGLDPLDYFETEGSDFSVEDITEPENGRTYRWFKFFIFDEAKTVEGMNANIDRAIDDTRNAFTKEDQDRILSLLDSHFPQGGLKALSPQALSVLDRLVGQAAECVDGYANITPAQVEGIIEIYNEVWNEGFTALHSRRKS